MYIMPSVEGGIFLPFKGEKKHIKHYILWYELFDLHRYRGYPTFRVLILFMPESTEGVGFASEHFVLFWGICFPDELTVIRPNEGGKYLRWKALITATLS